MTVGEIGYSERMSSGDKFSSTGNWPVNRTDESLSEASICRVKCSSQQLQAPQKQQRLTLQ